MRNDQRLDQQASEQPVYFDATPEHFAHSTIVHEIVDSPIIHHAAVPRMSILPFFFVIARVRAQIMADCSLFRLNHCEICDPRLNHLPDFFGYVFDALVTIGRRKSPFAPTSADQVDSEKRTFDLLVSIRGETEVSDFDEDSIEEGRLS